MKRTDAFSLLELTIAVALIGVVLILGMSGYSKMGQSAGIVADVANLRQIGVGAHRYIAENGGKLPPVVGRKEGQLLYAQEFIAMELGITPSLRATQLPRNAWGPMISPLDKGEPPDVSPLRSYGVNFFMGEIVTLTYVDVRLALRYSDVKHPSRILYFLPMVRETKEPAAQSRFSELTGPGYHAAGYIRTDTKERTVALWADGHASPWEIPADRAEFARHVLPRTP